MDIRVPVRPTIVEGRFRRNSPSTIQGSLRGLEFVTELPKTISGKIRRVQLRRLEHDGVTEDPHRGRAYTQSDFPELKGETERKLDQTAG